ncbi:hypothetical protein IFM89_005164 [Coptis chinensis]|uniref:F-box domain-containing protein n=1 Tax=Coptis chinensis TaxID=261450 RepID=A0A835M4S1_9MAGN|nr:hypothetical protein IFM89_005164 [Coptis chinensis]
MIHPEKVRISDADKISGLPDEVLVHILSLVDMKEVMHTSVLSKRWRYLWRSVPSLNFNSHLWRLPNKGEWDIRKEGFMEFVEKTLSLHDGFNVDKFSLYYYNPSDACARIHEWIALAVSRHVQHLCLGHITLLPTWLLGQVTTLELRSVRIPNQMPYENKELVFNLELVENLILQDCDYLAYNTFIISAPKLKYMRVVNKVCSKIKVCAPSLMLLQFIGEMYEDYSLDNLSSLVTAELRLDCHGSDFLKGRPVKKKKLRCLNNFLEGICNVQSLTLSTYYFQNWPELFEEWEPIIFHKVKCLKLTDWQVDGDIGAIDKLLMCFPNIETLRFERTVMLSQKGTGSCEKSGDQGSLLSVSCMFPHLKNIEIQNLRRCDNVFNFLEFLVENTLNLESITLKASDRMPEYSGKEVVNFCKRRIMRVVI